MRKELERIIDRELDRLPEWQGCEDLCWTCGCRNWFYPCGYNTLCELGFELGTEIWNSNMEDGYRSFAPTHYFDCGDCILIVAASGWEIIDKAGL